MSLLDACKNGDLDAVETCLNNPNADVNETDPYGWTPLFVACSRGDTDIVKLLMEDKRVDPNQTDPYGKTPFFLACEHGHIQVVKLLINDPRVKVDQPNAGYWTPFAIACFEGHSEIELFLRNKRNAKAERKAMQSFFNNKILVLQSLLDLPDLQNLSLSEKPDLGDMNSQDRCKSLLLHASEGNLDEIKEVVKVINKNQSPSK
jgi:ankyrin repeat protein